MSKILIIGAASGVGASLATSLLQNTTHSVISVDDLRAETKLHNMQFALSHKKGDRHKFHLTSVADPHLCHALFSIEDPDIVVFCKTPEPHSYHQSLVHSIHEAQVRNKKYIYLIPEHADPFAREQLSLGLDVCNSDSVKDFVHILFTCRVFGPRQGKQEPLTRLMCSIINGDEVQPHASDELSEWIYIKDIISGLEYMIDQPEMRRHTIKTGQTASELEIFKYLSELPYSRESTFGMLEHTNSDIPGWEPRHKLASALEHTIAWYSINQWARV
jgi:dTDP-D-glucose 4,6-dehydratase